MHTYATACFLIPIIHLEHFKQSANIKIERVSPVLFDIYSQLVLAWTRKTPKIDSEMRIAEKRSARVTEIGRCQKHSRSPHIQPPLKGREKRFLGSGDWYRDRKQVSPGLAGLSGPA